MISTIRSLNQRGEGFGCSRTAPLSFKRESSVSEDKIPLNTECAELRFTDVKRVLVS